MTLLVVRLAAVAMVAASGRAAAVTGELSGLLVQDWQLDRKEYSYSAGRTGGSLSAANLGFWGYAEVMHTQLGPPVRYGELAGMYSFGDTAVTVGGGGGSDERFAASSMLLGEVSRRFAAQDATVFAGVTRAVYAYADPDLYNFYRAGWQQGLASGWSGQSVYQLIENHTASGALRRVGSAVALSLTTPQRPWSATLGLSGSCLAESVACGGRRPRESYSEAFATARVPVNEMYGFLARAAFIIETGDLAETGAWPVLTSAVETTYQASLYRSVQIQIGVFACL